MSGIKLYKHQKRVIDLNPSRYLLCHDTGSGKTITAIFWANKNKLFTIIVCPKSIKKKWQDACDSYGTTSFFVVTKEEFKKYIMEKKWDVFREDEDVAIVVDEAHYFAGMKSQFSKILIKFNARMQPRILLLTATPFRSSPWDIYRLAQILGYKWSYIRFKEKYFYNIEMGARMIPKIRPGMEDEVAKMVNKIGDIVHLTECVDVPQQIFKEESFPMTKEQREAIKQINTEEFNPAVKYGKHHQIENGTLKSDGYTNDKEFDCLKTDRIIEYALNNKKLIVVARYNLQLEMYQKKLTKLGLKSIIINGNSKLSATEACEKADKMEQCVLLINAFVSDGYEARTFRVMLFTSLEFGFINYKQMRGRILRIDNLQKNVYVHLKTIGGIDEKVYETVTVKKKKFSLKIYATEML